MKKIVAILLILIPFISQAQNDTTAKKDTVFRAVYIAEKYDTVAVPVLFYLESGVIKYVDKGFKVYFGKVQRNPDTGKWSWVEQPLLFIGLMPDKKKRVRALDF